jgi:hypothetical protein
MIKKFLLLTIASLVMLPVLADKPIDKPDKGGGAAPLKVEFDNGISYKFVNDSKGIYEDGSDGVETQIDKFRFGLNVGQNGPRNFYLELSGCVAVSTCTPPFVAGLTRGWNVFATSPGGAQYLKMTVGEDPKPVNFSLDFYDRILGRLWRIKFNPSECPGVELKDTATVTKINDHPDTWVFEAANDAVACLNRSEQGHPRSTFHGLYYLPFKLTATPQ